jgi:uncharacterized protein (DUF1810 family)
MEEGKQAFPCDAAAGLQQTYAREMSSFDLQRFLEAQAPVWDDVRSELAQARKRSHWMWFVFPQLAALGRSGTARFYGIGGAEEARAYLQHPVLGARLHECCALLLQSPGVSARDVFGEVDAMKLRSCLTLFEAVSPQTPIFQQCLDRYFSGERDPLTKELLSS